MTRYLFAALAIASLCVPGAAQTIRKNDLAISSPWTRQTAPGQSVGGGFMTIANGGKSADKLVSASSPAARKVEIHSMTMDGRIMRMRAVPDGLPIPAAGVLELKPGGFHIMLIGLKAPLALGKSVPLTLRFAKAGTVTVQLKVEPVTHGMGGGHDGH
jgi:Uncharacterized protein conserved in bacteria